MKRIRCRSRGASFHTMLMQYSILALFITLSSNIRAQQGNCILPTDSFVCTAKAATLPESVWAIEDTIQAVVGGGTNVAGPSFDQVHIIDQNSIPFIIEESGRYKLCQDITAPSGGNFAIQIRTTNVHLDLDGHTVTKAAHAGTSTRQVIDINGANGVVVENGIIAIEFSPQLNAASTMNGVRSLNSQSVVIRNLMIAGINTDIFNLPAGYTENAVRIAQSNSVTVQDVQTRAMNYSVNVSNSSAVEVSHVNSIAVRQAVFNGITSSSLYVHDTQGQFIGQAGYFVSQCTSVLFKNCIAETSNFNGFHVAASSFAYAVGCDAIACGQSSSPGGTCYAGFFFDGQSTFFGAIDCAASGCPGFGFNLQADGTVYRSTATMCGGGCGTAGDGFISSVPACWFSNNLSDQNASAGTDFTNVNSLLVAQSSDLDGSNDARPRFWHNVNR